MVLHSLGMDSLRCAPKPVLTCQALQRPLVPAPCSFETHRVHSRTAISAASDTQPAAQQPNRIPKKQPAPGQQQRRRLRQGPLPPPLTNKPFLVRVAGRTSSIQGAAGAVVKRLRTEDLVRVAAIDGGSISKALLVLTAANNMLAANTGQMVVFQPTVITNDAEAPKVPTGALVMYTGAIMQGEVMAFNVLPVRPDTELLTLASAIISRVKLEAHTVLECYGAVAVASAVRAIAQARKSLLAGQQDLACVIASGRKEASDAAPAAAAPTSSGTGSSSKYASTCHRLVVLECQPRKPRALLVSSSMGMTDRVQYTATGSQPTRDDAVQDPGAGPAISAPAS